jgi:hypothetical protein
MEAVVQHTPSSLYPRGMNPRRGVLETIRVFDGDKNHISIINHY